MWWGKPLKKWKVWVCFKQMQDTHTPLHLTPYVFYLKMYTLQIKPAIKNIFKCHLTHYVHRSIQYFTLLSRKNREEWSMWVQRRLSMVISCIVSCSADCFIFVLCTSTRFWLVEAHSTTDFNAPGTSHLMCWATPSVCLYFPPSPGTQTQRRWICYLTTVAKKTSVLNKKSVR